MLTETTNVAQARRSSLKKKFKNAILKFQKNLRVNIDLDDVVFYQCAKFKLEIYHTFWAVKK
jgi:hypothetical protein